MTFFFISIDKNGRVRVSIVDFERVDGPRVGDLAKEFRRFGLLWAARTMDGVVMTPRLEKELREAKRWREEGCSG